MRRKFLAEPSVGREIPAMNPEERQLRDEISRLDQAARAALETNENARFRQSIRAQVEPLAKVAQLRTHEYDFVAAESFLDRLRTILDGLRTQSDPKDKVNLEATLKYTEAILFDVRGTYNLFDRLMLVEAPVELEQAEKRYDRVVELMTELGVNDATIGGVRGMALRTKGIRFFGQGRFHIEAADLPRAKGELEGSQALLNEAAEKLQPMARQGIVDPQSAMYPAYCTSLAAYATAFRFRCESDAAAFQGQHQEAAERLGDQYRGMEHAKQALLGMTYKLADTLAHRIAQEMELCDKRQKFFSAEAQKPHPVQSFSAGTILFAGLTLTTFAIQVGAFKFAGVQMSVSYYILVLAASLATGGIGAGLASYSEGTGFFERLAGRMAKPEKLKAAKPKKPSG